MNTISQQQPRSLVIWYPCLPNWMRNCVCKPGDKTDCGIPLAKTPKGARP